jgi:hypothetical protein
MNASLSASLLFNWEPPRQRIGAITAFLVASLIAHAVCFYIFQIVYPPTVALLPAPTRISLIAPDSEEGRTLLRWIEAEDPALAFATQRPPEARLHALPKVRHLPFYLAREPALKELPPMITNLRAPSSQPPGAVPILHPPALSTVGTVKTSVSFSNELDALGSPSLPQPNFSASNNESPENVRFRIAVDDGGEIRYCFLLNPSGDAALDEQARHYLISCRFPGKSSSTKTAAASATPTSDKDDAPLTWGVATIEWGSDVSRSRLRATSAITNTP